MTNNELCGVNLLGDGTYTTEGITKLCEALKGSAVTSLKCTPPRVFACVSAPIDTPTFSPFPSCPFFACSISGNFIGAEGASALAAILKETQITTLG